MSDRSDVECTSIAGMGNSNFVVYAEIAIDIMLEASQDLISQYYGFHFSSVLFIKLYYLRMRIFIEEKIRMYPT